MSEINQASFKLAPGKTLSAEQEALKRGVEAFLDRHRHDQHALFVIHGEAGTGKSVLLNTLFGEIQTQARLRPPHPLYGSENYLLVNHPEMLKAYKNAADNQPALRKKDYERPTTFINRMHKRGAIADIVLVDEAHLLLTRRDSYNHFFQDNHLEEIIRLARIVVLVFDEQQVLKFKSLWRESDLSRMLTRWPHEVYALRRQFRMRADAASLRWIRAFCQRRLLPLPGAEEAFEIGIFDDAQAMYERVKEKNAARGLSRMLSTYDYPYRLDGQDYFIEEGRFRLRWDRAKPNERLPWAEREDTIDEVGSVYTVQGFDLNYVGLILGPSVAWDAQREEIVLDAARYEDSAAFQGQSRIENSAGMKERIMLNAINVLMTRAIHGLYIYAHDRGLRNKLMSLARK
ncbi:MULTISPECIES: DUF2075 domain-containing protein [Brenneria]|uniref:DUF2075 domain-containing protein n=1 Tax=Brenneria nigrifluens DSM 30175 = ATCC 13028 TaxID=1121120 RepID=A0A2U1UV37_9GAMM|nr:MULTISPECIES: DUF2075 domain-containing protein [Brenneria]EHD20122.1 Protein of unknown function DUF2075 [Brenneria sp. EniD312]PWC25482.1 DUF2075 domain-containing protein [Brenneria nigrifluens DSM 30175 = ATCC 13028]QCR03353.1 DUF2075 domain-containing protein [Brenneria nigrifluens DSM 30175 = ATCC 13028]